MLHKSNTLAKFYELCYNIHILNKQTKQLNTHLKTMSNTMQKLTITHITNINNLMLKTISSYINTYSIANTYDTLVVTDVLYNTYALQKFNNTKNVQQLHNAIIAQDTLVREYFVNVLQYIENNNLIATHKFCCS